MISREGGFNLEQAGVAEDKIGTEEEFNSKRKSDGFLATAHTTKPTEGNDFDYTDATTKASTLEEAIKLAKERFETRWVEDYPAGTEFNFKITAGVVDDDGGETVKTFHKDVYVPKAE